jgi:hypothetical protein
MEHIEYVGKTEAIRRIINWLENEATLDNIAETLSSFWDSSDTGLVDGMVVCDEDRESLVYCNALPAKRGAMRYDVLSPDGFSIRPEDTYPTRAAAESALRDWVKRFEFQGFYSTARRERIPLDELPGRCRIVEAAPEDEED